MMVCNIYRVSTKFVFTFILALGLSGCGYNSTNEGYFIKGSSYSRPQNTSYNKAVQNYKAEYEQNQDSLVAAVEYARALRYIGQSRQALNILEDARARFGEPVLILTEIGKAYLTEGEFKLAENALNSSLEKEGNNWEAYSALGILYDLQENYDIAVQSYNKAFQLCPESASILNNMAMSSAMTGDVIGGKSLLIKASSLRPHSKRIRNNLSLFQRLLVLCPDCSADEYQEIIKATIVGQDWGRGDLACSTGIGDIVETLSHSNFIDLKVEFEFDSSKLLPEARKTLDTLARAFSSDQLMGLNFTLEGHTDAVGTDEYNQELSERRAAVVKTYLINMLGMDKNKLTSAGYGESQLLDTENPYSGVNRRVRVVRMK